jgi:hypothetical protein
MAKDAPAVLTLEMTLGEANALIEAVGVAQRHLDELDKASRSPLACVSERLVLRWQDLVQARRLAKDGQDG